METNIEEIWKDVVGYTGYRVSNFGRVINSKGIEISKTPNFLGYMRVSIKSESGKWKLVRVHKLVAAAFIDNPDRKPIVNHKDSNRANNFVWNLEWVTYKENSQHAKENGSFDGLGRSNKITFEQADDIRSSIGMTKSELAKKYSVSVQFIYQVIRGNRKVRKI